MSIRWTEPQQLQRPARPWFHHRRIAFPTFPPVPRQPARQPVPGTPSRTGAWHHPQPGSAGAWHLRTAQSAGAWHPWAKDEPAALIKTYVRKFVKISVDGAHFVRYFDELFSRNVKFGANSAGCLSPHNFVRETTHTLSQAYLLETLQIRKTLSIGQNLLPWKIENYAWSSWKCINHFFRVETPCQFKFNKVYLQLRKNYHLFAGAWR